MTYWGVIGRTALVFAALWGITRILGKKQISQLTLFDYITGITIGSMAANVVDSPDEYGQHLFAMGLWGAFVYALHWVDLKSQKAEQVLDGTPTILVQHGQVMEENLKQVELNMGQLMALLRTKGFFNLPEVEFALMENNGQLSVLPRSQYRPVRPMDLLVTTNYEGLPVELIHEGRILPESLEKIGRTHLWLHDEMARQGYVSVQEVFTAWYGTDGKLTVDPYSDRTDHPH